MFFFLYSTYYPLQYNFFNHLLSSYSISTSIHYFILIYIATTFYFYLRNQMASSLIWLWWVIDLARFKFESGIVLFCFCFIFVSFGESRLLISWCAGGRCGMTCSDKDRGRSRIPGAEDQRWSHKSGTWWLSDREVGWRRVRSAPGTWHHSGGCVRGKLKTDGSMRRAASDPATLPLPFLMY
jgi:hypothetical protein